MKPSNEIEVSAALIKNQYKCPYTLDDPRCIIWLEGYKEGYCQGCDKGIEALKRVVI
jgi:hypothetical protein